MGSIFQLKNGWVVSYGNATVCMRVRAAGGGKWGGSTAAITALAPLCARLPPNAPRCPSRRPSACCVAGKATNGKGAGSGAGCVYPRV